MLQPCSIAHCSGSLVIMVANSEINFTPLSAVSFTLCLDDWVSACRKVAGVRCRGRRRKTWRKCVKDDMEVLGLQPERWAVFGDIWWDFILGQTFNPS